MQDKFFIFTGKGGSPICRVGAQQGNRNVSELIPPTPAFLPEQRNMETVASPRTCPHFYMKLKRLKVWVSAERLYISSSERQDPSDPMLPRVRESLKAHLALLAEITKGLP